MLDRGVVPIADCSGTPPDFPASPSVTGSGGGRQHIAICHKIQVTSYQTTCTPTALPTVLSLTTLERSRFASTILTLSTWTLLRIG